MEKKKEVKPIIQDEIPSSLDTDSMKQMDETVSRQAISVPAIERTKLTDLEERQKFNDWMLSSGMVKGHDYELYVFFWPVCKACSKL